MLLVVLAVLLSSMLLLTFCVVFFQEKHDKILAANSLSTHVIVLSCLYSTLVSDHNFLDIAYIYAFMGFIGLVAIINFILYNNLRHR
ncbi:monovalent cation/H+ antiporter complex subunit F [Neorickettsia risticii]|uniref:Multiple resistance and pH regulation protein F (MrpF / PhaF) n=1 Tax=Neorickettsia risticii (strain Illinois) TaxID=434131 RepID=C6V454_NEORI|nr:multiple resistance and pH regulation protein F (MrpF / PhaF) [Neorickettsia risticii str. Illinois]